MLQNGFISVTDFWHNPLRIFAAHEISAVIDPAMTTKMTVSFVQLFMCLLGIMMQILRKHHVRLY